MTEPIMEAIPPVKFTVKLFEGLAKEHDPEVLAYFACTTAYQRSIEQATEVLSPSLQRDLKEGVENALENLREAQDEEPKLRGMTLGGALSLPFIDKADDFLENFARLVGYDTHGVAELTRDVHVRFLTNLKLLLSHGKTREKFAPLIQHLEFGGGEEVLVHEALLIHAEYQRRLFEEARVLGREPFSLMDVYVDMECGVLTWDQVRKMDDPETGKPCKPNPFDERFGGRHSLLVTTIENLKDPKFQDAIVVQGVAGSGKSTFTLRLCAELVREGFRPIRVRLRDVVFDRHPRDSLARAVRLVDEGNQQSLPRPEHKFLDGKIFQDSVRFGRARICPYVLILDGWDEISISADEGFKKRVNDFLEKVRDEYLRNRDVPIRLVVTGRPTTDVTFEDSPFFTDKTLLLTVRELSPKKLGELVERTAAVVNEARLGWLDHADKWSAPKAHARGALVEHYGRGFREAREREQEGEARAGSFSIVGLPLLTHMTVRLLAERGADVESLLQAPTTLYRRLTDLTCGKSAKPPDDDLGVTGRYRIAGEELRHLLHLTATAMTIQGEESIAHDDLADRIENLGRPLDDESLHEYAAKATEPFPITSLMISYFFKGGRTELGCEFVHKSFREYLFAEAIIDTLKRFAEGPDVLSRSRPLRWSDFPSTDPRYALSRALSSRLGAQWLSEDEIQHIGSLISWEIERSAREDDNSDIHSSVRKLSRGQWEKVRDGLTDLWEWWAEGVHLRPSVRRRRKQPNWMGSELYSMELIREIYPASLPDRRELPAPVRVVTVDAHLGDGLFRLCAWVHAALNQGHCKALHSRAVAEVVVDGSDYQTRCIGQQGAIAFFRPGGKSSGFLKNFIARINGAGWRQVEFPAWVEMPRVDFSETDLSGVNLSGANLRGADLSSSELYRADLHSADLRDANLGNAYLGLANLSEANLTGADLDEASFPYADLSDADIHGARFGGRIPIGDRFSGANLNGANLSGSDFSGPLCCVTQRA